MHKQEQSVISNNGLLIRNPFLSSQKQNPKPAEANIHRPFRLQRSSVEELSSYKGQEGVLVAEVRGYPAMHSQTQLLKKFTLSDRRGNAILCHFYSVDFALPRLSSQRQVWCYGKVDEREKAFIVYKVQNAEAEK